MSNQRKSKNVIENNHYRRQKPSAKNTMGSFHCQAQPQTNYNWNSSPQIHKPHNPNLTLPRPMYKQEAPHKLAKIIDTEQFINRKLTVSQYSDNNHKFTKTVIKIFPKSHKNNAIHSKDESSRYQGKGSTNVNWIRNRTIRIGSDYNQISNIEEGTGQRSRSHNRYRYNLKEDALVQSVEKQTRVRSNVFRKSNKQIKLMINVRKEDKQSVDQQQRHPSYYSSIKRANNKIDHSDAALPSILNKETGTVFRSNSYKNKQRVHSHHIFKNSKKSPNATVGNQRHSEYKYQNGLIDECSNRKGIDSLDGELKGWSKQLEFSSPGPAKMGSEDDQGLKSFMEGRLQGWHHIL